MENILIVLIGAVIMTCNCPFCNINENYRNCFFIGELVQITTELLQSIWHIPPTTAHRAGV